MIMNVRDEVFKKLIKEALATILTKKITCKGEKWYDKLFNVKYLPLFHHFKAIYQLPKHVIFLVKIVANASLITGKL
jgi:hypothetical protein